MTTFLTVLDLAGTFVFALSGASAGVKHRLDLFGVVVLSYAVGSFGGIARDVLIGAVPPAGLADWRYVAVSAAAGLVTFYWHPFVDRMKNPVLVFDAAGLALFAVVGTSKALAFHLGPVPAVLLGMLTGVGGGMVRDVLVSEVPAVLRAEIYAVAALAGGALVVLARSAGLPAGVATGVGALFCFGLRFIAIRKGWQLPVAAPSRVDPPAR